jgi:hypothetical protein
MVERILSDCVGGRCPPNPLGFIALFDVRMNLKKKERSPIAAMTSPSVSSPATALGLLPSIALSSKQVIITQVSHPMIRVNEEKILL